MEFVVKSVIQATAGLLLAVVFWGLHWSVARLRRRRPEGWTRWLGLTRPPSLRLGLTLFVGFLALGAVLPALGQGLIPGHDAMAMASPQFEIAGLPLAALLLAAPA